VIVHTVVVFFTLLLLIAEAGAQTKPAASPSLRELLDLRPGQWRELPNTKMNSVFPSPNQTTWAVVGPAAVILAWGGGAYDSKRNAFVFTGGGHGDYGGNEVYAFFLEQLKWVRLTEPSRTTPFPNGVYLTSDNTPISAHTYGSLLYLANVDRIFRTSPATPAPHAGTAWLFDIDSRRWTRGPEGTVGIPVGAYDPVRGVAYLVTNTTVDEYNPLTNKWVRRVSGEADALPNVGGLDSGARRLITDSYRPGVIVYEIDENGAVSHRNFLRTQGATDWDKKMLALEYDPVRKVMVAWAGDRETAYLDAKSLIWRRLLNRDSATAPVKDPDKDYPASGAIYGRWRYVPKYDIFIGYNNPLGNIWIWKPAAVSAADATAANPDPQPVIKPLLDSLRPGQTVSLPPGVYKEAAAITASDVTIKAHGVRLEKAAFGGKAAVVVSADNVTIEGLECSGIRVPDANGACIRLEGSNLTLRKVFFHDSQSGLLSWNKDSGTVLIEDSRFERLGRAHGVYIGRGPTHLIIRRSSFFSSMAEGHEIKSRAARTTIEESVVASLDGVDSRLIDLPEGGENLIRRNVLEEGPNSSNQDVIGVGLETANIHPGRTTIEDNVIIMERRGMNVLLNERHVPASIVRRNKVIGGTRTAGDNTWFPDRKSAGIGAYPSLPDPVR